MWDVIGRTSDGRPVPIEAKAHIPEAASPACRASDVSMPLIQKSLDETSRAHVPRAKAQWTKLADSSAMLEKEGTTCR